MKRKAVNLLLRKADMRDTGGHKEYKYLYQRMLGEETIRKAYKKLRKGKTKRNEIIYIDAHLDEEVQKMHDMILNTKRRTYPWNTRNRDTARTGGHQRSSLNTGSTERFICRRFTSNGSTTSLP